MIFYEQPTDKWTRFDFLLLEAYQILQDETCPQCGQPVWICRSDSSDVNVKVRTATCNVTAEVEKKRKAMEKKAQNGKAALKPGEYLYPVVEPVPIPGARLPTRREFYEAQQTPD